MSSSEAQRGGDCNPHPPRGYATGSSNEKLIKAVAYAAHCLLM